MFQEQKKAKERKKCRRGEETWSLVLGHVCEERHDCHRKMECYPKKTCDDFIADS